MESLSPECTTTKQRYDSCFNAWFEGYLQPALVDMPSRRTLDSSSSDTSSSSGSSHGNNSHDSTLPPPERARVSTSWANAFGLGRRSTAPVAQQTLAQDDRLPAAAAAAAPSAPVVELPPIDTRGKTRAQIKAEEYDRHCGQAWTEYNACVKKAISTNSSLSSLLEQARSEHPLGRLEGLEGTPWDPNAKLDS